MENCINNSAASDGYNCVDCGNHSEFGQDQSTEDTINLSFSNISIQENKVPVADCNSVPELKNTGGFSSLVAGDTASNSRSTKSCESTSNYSIGKSRSSVDFSDSLSSNTTLSCLEDEDFQKTVDSFPQLDDRNRPSSIDVSATTLESSSVSEAIQSTAINDAENSAPECGRSKNDEQYNPGLSKQDHKLASNCIGNNQAMNPTMNSTASSSPLWRNDQNAAQCLKDENLEKKGFVSPSIDHGKKIIPMNIIENMNVENSGDNSLPSINGNSLGIAPDIVESNAYKVSGCMKKRSDYLGIWRNRYFELNAYSSCDLKKFGDIPVESLFGEENDSTRKMYFLSYWCKETEIVNSEGLENRPRGIYAVTQKLEVSLEIGLVLVLRGLTNAVNPLQKVPVMHLRASNARGFKKWLSAFGFAVLADTFDAISLRAFKYYPTPVHCGSLEISTSDTSKKFVWCFIRLYRSQEDENRTMRAFLMIWDNESTAETRPLQPKNMYEITHSTASVSSSSCVSAELELNNVEVYRVQKSTRTMRNIHLKLPSYRETLELAEMLVPDPLNRNTQFLQTQELVDGTLGECFVDEYIPTSPTFTSPEINMTMMNHNEEIIDELYLQEDDGSYHSDGSVNEVSFLSDDGECLMSDLTNNPMLDKVMASFDEKPTLRLGQENAILQPGSLQKSQDLFQKLIDYFDNSGNANGTEFGRFRPLSPVREEEIEDYSDMQD